MLAFLRTFTELNTKNNLTKKHRKKTKKTNWDILKNLARSWLLLSPVEKV